MLSLIPAYMSNGPKQTSGQSNLTEGSIAVAYGRLNRIRQVASMCTLITPQSASAPYRCCPLLSRFEYIDRMTYPGMSWAGPILPSKLPLHAWGSGPYPIHGSLGLSESTSQTESRSVQPILHSSWQRVPILYNGTPAFPPQNCLLYRVSWTPI